MILVMSFPGTSNQGIDNDCFGAVAAVSETQDNFRFVPRAAFH